MSDASTYGMVAEFNDPTAIVEAARKIKQEGYRKLEAYTPYPIKDLHQVIHVVNWVPFICFTGGLTGAAIAWSMQYYIAAIDYPINVGGRPLYSWPAFIPILFELTVLLAGCSAFFGVLALAGFPRPHFPLFNLPQFANATSDRLFLCIEKTDPIYDSELTGRFLRELGPTGVWEVSDT